MSDSLGALLRSLQLAGVAMDADLARDSLWLALRIQERSGQPLAIAPDESGRRPANDDAMQEGVTRPSDTTPLPPSPAPIVATGGGTPRFALADDEVDALDTTDGRWVTLERTASLSMGLELSRALRPLRRRVKVPGRGRLDVEATVRRIIDEFIFLPSFLPARERWLDVLLVLDHGLSMIVWKETLDAFERVLRTSGAFRSVRSFWLESDLATPTVTSRSGGAKARPALQLPAAAHARSRTVVLAVSDCVGGRWHDGTVPDLLAAWGEALPVSLLQVTPDWYWPRTALGEAATGPLFAQAALTRNSRLTWSSTAMGLDGLLPGEAGPFAPVPLAAMTAHDIGRLARLLAGSGDGSVRGALFDLSWRGEAASGVAITPQSRVARFHALATVEARRLASAFASSPVQTLGMLRLLRRDLLPGSRPFVEAEVLLGGLLRVRAEDASWDAGAALRLEFMDGVRGLLQDSATVPDILRVLRHASRAAEGGGSATFSAWLSAPELQEAGLEELGEAFAGAAAPVLRRLGGAYARGVQGVAAGTVPSEQQNASATNAVDDSMMVSAEDPPPVESAERVPSGATTAEAERRTMRARTLESAVRFVGREKEVEWLLSIARGGRGKSVRIAWLEGVEGVGKSALLAELVRAWNARFSPEQAFYWSFASEPSIRLWLRTLTDAVSKSSDGSNADPTELRAILLGALAQSKRSLLVLDAVDRLEQEEWRSLHDTLDLLARSLGRNLSIVVASRAPLDSDLSVSSLQLEPLPRDALDELIQLTVRDPRFNRSPSEGFTDQVRERAMASGQLLADLSGGNPAVLLSLMELMATGITPEEIREQFVGKDGELAPLSAGAFRLANPPFYDIREVRALVESAGASVAEGKLAEALRDAERALGIAEQIGMSRPVGGELIARSHEAIGRIHLRMGNREEGTAQLGEALRLAEASGAKTLASSLRDFLDYTSPSFDDPHVQAVFHVYGRLSGVGYRHWAREQANELQLEGSVENLPDGRIRVTASGPQSRVDTLEQRLRVGPPMARVTRVTREGVDVASVGTDVFLSYASADKQVASRIAELLVAEGLSVYVDQASLQASDAWREALDASLDRARCVVMLLSRASVRSDWVLRESRRGLQRQVLVPVLLERGVPLPVELRELSLGDLSGWDRSADARAFRDLLLAIVRVVGGDPQREESAPPAEEIAQEVSSEDPEQSQSADWPPAEASNAAPAAAPHAAPAATPSIDLATLDLEVLDGPGWVQLAAATFRMGSSDGEEREQPEHVVGCSSFRISRFPVTNRQYERFLKVTSSQPPAHWEGGRVPRGTDEHPVTNVSWHDAANFCSWLSQLVSTNARGTVQLPTEAQWEFAARGVEGRRYPWGDASPSPDLANFGGLRNGITPVNAHPAGATPSGIWDMAGNTWEWCRDWYGPYPSEAVEDPTGAMKGSVLVIRGGSHRSESGKLRAAYRANRPPDEVFDRCGFRVVWSDARGKGAVES